MEVVPPVAVLRVLSTIFKGFDLSSEGAEGGCVVSQHILSVPHPVLDLCQSGPEFVHVFPNKTHLQLHDVHLPR